MRKELSRATSKRAPKLVYVTGTEPYFRRVFLNKVKAHYKSREYTVEVVDAATTKGTELVETLDSASLFARKRLVIIANTEKLKGKQPALVTYIGDPADDVVALFEANPPKKGGSASSPLIKALTEQAVVYDAKPLGKYRGEVEKWLQQEAGAEGFTLPPSFARVIRSATGDDLFALRNALNKVLLHVDGTVVEKADIVAVLTRTATNKTYEITEAYNERDLKRVLSLLDAMYHQTDDPSLMVTSALLNNLDRLIRTKSLLAYGLSAKDAAAVLGVNPYMFSKQLVPQLKKFTITELVNSHTAMCEVDIAVKGGGVDNRVLLEAFLVQSLS